MPSGAAGPGDRGASTRRITVLGELVVDLLPVLSGDSGPAGTAPQYVARPGGNALNVAVTAGRLGAPVELRARLGTGPLGGNLRRHAELSGVDVSGFVSALEPVSLAVVGLRDDGSADYGFHVLGAADWQWTDDELADVVPETTAILHIGSISGWTAPGSEAIARLAERLHAAGSIISLDPNIRPMLAEGPAGASLGNDAAVVRARLERLLSVADIVKVSSEDLVWLEPGSPTDAAGLDAAVQRWAGLGPALTLLTDGGAALRVGRPGRPVRRFEPPQVTVADTVGAGDSLAAGLLCGLFAAGVRTQADLRALDDAALRAVLDDAVLVAALTCTRTGADPPTAAELDAARCLR
jgi:fructokinase